MTGTADKRSSDFQQSQAGTKFPKLGDQQPGAYNRGAPNNPNMIQTGASPAFQGGAQQGGMQQYGGQQPGQTHAFGQKPGQPQAGVGFGGVGGIPGKGGMNFMNPEQQRQLNEQKRLEQEEKRKQVGGAGGGVVEPDLLSPSRSGSYV